MRINVNFGPVNKQNKKANCYKNEMEQIYGYIPMNVKLIANQPSHPFLIIITLSLLCYWHNKLMEMETMEIDIISIGSFIISNLIFI